MAKVKLLDPADPRRRLDRYELIGEIATGGMATVFLARLGGVGGFQRFVAIKRLHPHLANEQEFVEMFLDEARLAALIHHPHVVPILEVGVSDSGYYIVMEYVEGDTLSKIVARSMSGGKMVPRHILMRIILDMLTGLHAAHELADERGALLGLVHRDVSPQNVLVGVDGSTRITDFGVARATARLTSTGSGKLKGKLAYMAPEQTRGDELDRRTDLFAAGIICWEVLAGKRLFKAETEAATLNRILVEPVRPVSEINPEVPKLFDTILAKALDREASGRYQTASEMGDAFEKAAMDSAKASATDVGVASPRDVASYVQQILGQEIGAQRESVRAWLAQSDSSNPRVSAGMARDLGSAHPPRSSAPSHSNRGEPPHRRRRDSEGAEPGIVGGVRGGLYDPRDSDPSEAGEGPRPITPLADVTMRFALADTSIPVPPRAPPPAKKSSPTLLGQGPMFSPAETAELAERALGAPPPSTAPMAAIGPGSPAATGSSGMSSSDTSSPLSQSSRPPHAAPVRVASQPPQTQAPAAGQTGLAVAGLGEDGDDAPTILKQSSRPPSASELAPPPHQVMPSVKTARGLFAADLLDRARLEAEKAQARNGNGSHHPGANGFGANGADGSYGNGANGAHATSVDPRNEPTDVVPRPFPGMRVVSSPPEAAHPSMTNGSMTLPPSSASPIYATDRTSSPPPKKSAAPWVILGVAFLAVFGGGFVFLQMRASDNAKKVDVASPESTTTAETKRPEPARTAASQTPTATSEPTSSPSAQSSSRPLPLPVGPRTGGTAKHPPTKGGKEPKGNDTPTPPTTVATPPAPKPPGDDLTNPYR